MAFSKDKIKNDLKKAIYKAIAKAYKQNIPFVKQAVDGINKEHAVNHIIADLDDENMVAEVPENHIPVDKDNVLHKDVPSVKELHDAKQLQAKAQLGIMPAAGQKGAVYMSEGPSKGVQKLKKFMGERELKMEKARIDQKMPTEEKQQARWDRAGDPVKGVHTAPFKSAPGLSTAGYEIESTGKPTGVARASHEKVISEQKAMPKPNLPKSEEMYKDDMPHEAGSPEDSAHDVVEEYASLQEKIADLAPEEKAEMLAHLRTLKDRRKLRSAKNQAVGMNKSLKSGKWKK